MDAKPGVALPPQSLAFILILNSSFPCVTSEIRFWSVHR